MKSSQNVLNDYMVKHHVEYYDEFVQSLKHKNTHDIAIKLDDPVMMDILYAISGLAKESGELLDAFIRHLFYGTEFDITNVKEEVGDLEFYLSLLLKAIKATRGEVIERNVRKLMVRYPKGYFDEDDAVNRDYDKEREAMNHE